MVNVVYAADCSYAYRAREYESHSSLQRVASGTPLIVLKVEEVDGVVGEMDESSPSDPTGFTDDTVAFQLVSFHDVMFKPTGT